MLLRFAMLCLISALAAGVFGFEDTLPTLPETTTWGRYLFLPLVLVSVAALTAGVWHDGKLSLAPSQGEPDLETSRNHVSMADDPSLPILTMAMVAHFPSDYESTSHVQFNHWDNSCKRRMVQSRAER